MMRQRVSRYCFAGMVVWSGKPSKGFSEGVFFLLLLLVEEGVVVLVVVSLEPFMVAFFSFVE